MTKPFFLLVAVAVLVTSGCDPNLDSPEYGDLIQNVPPELDRAYPLPELDQPGPAPLAGPDSSPEPAQNQK